MPSTNRQTPPLRRPVVGRTPVSRHPFAPALRWRVPPRLRKFLVGQLLLIALLVLLGECQKPADLQAAALVGPRLAPGAICMEEAVDVSGSMQAFLPQREAAERELFAFARRSLAPGDQLSVAFFAGDAVLAQAPTGIGTLTTPPAVPGSISYDGTNLAPAIDELVRSRDAGSAACVARALVVITDGEVFDLDQTASALGAGGYTRLYAVVPAPTGSWLHSSTLEQAFQEVVVHRFDDAGIGGRVASVVADSAPLDVVYGRIAADLTGQQLQQIVRPDQ